jgi:hypothetical protein
VQVSLTLRLAMLQSIHWVLSVRVFAIEVEREINLKT